MDLAPQAFAEVAPPPAAEAPLPTPTADLDRAAATLADRAGAFARTPPREKAALLRAALPGLRAVAPEMVALTCRAAGVDPAGALAEAAWLSGPVALIAGVRRYAEALDEIATNGRPYLPVSHLRGRLAGRVVARLEPRRRAERVFQRGAEACAVLAEGVLPEEVIAGQAAFYRQGEPAGSVALVVAAGGAPSAGPLRALEALFVEGRVAILETTPARAPLGPLLERGLAPLIEAGFLRVVHGGEAPGAHLAATLGEPLVAGQGGGPVIVVPAFYAKDELRYVARRLVSELCAGHAFGVAAPREIVIAGCWAQRGLFVEHFERALTTLPPGRVPWTTLAEPAADPVAAYRSPAGAPPESAFRLVTVGCDEPAAMLAAAVGRCNAGPAATTAELVVHVLHEEDAEIAAAIDRAIARLRCQALGVNQWPALVSFRADAAEGPRMLARVDKTVVRGPLRSARPPAWFSGEAQRAPRGPRLAAFQAAPSLGALVRGARV